MAPPPNRRPGYNRKAQYGLFASYVIAVSGALVGLLLALSAAFDPDGFAALRSGMAEITRPLSAGSRDAVNSAGSFSQTLSDYFQAGRQNGEYRKKLEADANRIIQARAIEQENKRLKRLLRLVEDEPHEVVAARLISSSPSSTRRFARLNAGSRDGVRAGQPVRAAEGLIGRITEVGPDSALVLLLSDGDNVVPVRRVRDNVAALSTGRSDGMVDIRALSSGGRNPFRVGDIMVTSGTGGLYRPNIPVAIVRAVDGDIAIARPLANPSRTDLVIVEQVFEPSAETDVQAAAPGSSVAADAEAAAARKKPR